MGRHCCADYRIFRIQSCEKYLEVQEMRKHCKENSKENLRYDFLAIGLIGMLWSYIMFSWSKILSIAFGVFGIMMLVCANNNGQFILYGNDFSKRKA
jgi:hypothetical protein